MPVYQYECECGYVVRETRPMCLRNDWMYCTDCGEAMTLNPAAHSKTHSPNYHKPIELYSMAPETPEQHAELAAAGATFNPEGVPIAHNRTEKKRLMRAAGMVEMN